jgi:hypothetical protein
MNLEILATLETIQTEATDDSQEQVETCKNQFEKITGNGI